MNILVVKLSSFGDVIHTLPLLADIKQFDEHAQIDWVVEEDYVGLLNRVKQVSPELGLSRIISVSLRRWRKKWWQKKTWDEVKQFKKNLRQAEYDLVLDVQGLIKSAWVCSCTNKKNGGKTFGFANGIEGSGYEPLARLAYQYSVKIPPQIHAVDRPRFFWQHIIQSYFSKKKLLSHLDLADWSDTKRHLKNPIFGLSRRSHRAGSWRVLFCTHTAGEHKKWSESAWLELAKQFLSSGWQIDLAWGSEKEKLWSEHFCMNVHAAIPEQADAIRLADKQSWSEWCDTLPLYAAVIGVDTGLVHLAAALLCPTIEIYVGSDQWKTAGFWSDRIFNLGDQHKPPLPQEVFSAFLQQRHVLGEE